MERIDAYLHRHEVDGVALDPRMPLNPPEVGRLSITSQLLGYLELYATSPRVRYYDAIQSRSRYLVDHFYELQTESAFDGMLALALMGAYQVTGNARCLERAGIIVDRLKSVAGRDAPLNWGMMAAMGLAKAYEVNRDQTALAKAREIVGSLRASENNDGSFPHYCPGTRDIHYTGWIAMELLMVDRIIHDPVVDELLDDIHRFLATRVDSEGVPRYSDCPSDTTNTGWVPDSLDYDQDGIIDGEDRCLRTPYGCPVDASGCSRDEDGTGACDPRNEGPGTCPADYFSLGSGCWIDYDTRGWVNELGYLALVFDRFQSSRYHDVMGFLYRLCEHGAVPDKWGYWPAASDPGAVWTSPEASVMRTSVLFWSLATILSARGNPVPARYSWPRERGTLAAGDGSKVANVAELRWSRVDSLVLAGRGVDAASLASTTRSDPVLVPAAGVTVSDALAVDVRLGGRWGNHFRFHVRLEKRADLRIDVFDVSGRRVRRWSCGEKEARNHDLEWDLSDEDGRRVPAGVYQLRVESGRSSGVVTCVVMP